ncbi:hypothetical protein XP420_15900 [Xanthomonas perforans]|uniref:DNA polymerase III subunit beta n=1 Tax=Xanthomonas perforans TaxID=442694 RepID=UPI00062D637F|nr:DNA polymerase III subunit beta [Xanthomonas perforans]KLC04086.1 hypothetical protein XP420_15900 [Xanthomonas perforans]
MQITTSRDDLLAAIAPLMSVAQRGTKFRTGHASLTIRASEGSKIHFNTSDDNSDVCTSSTATIRERGEIGVSAKRLSDIMRSVDSGSTVEMERKGNFLNIKLGGSRFSINCDGPLSPVTRQAGKTDQTTGDFTLAADEFKYLLEAACSGVAGLGPDSKLPQGVLFHLTGERLRLVGTDGGRMAVASASVSTPQATKLVLGHNAVADIRTLLSKAKPDEQIGFSWGSGMAHIKTAHADLRVGVLASAYVDYENIMAANAVNPFHVGLASLRETLTRTLILSTAVTVKLNGRTLSFITADPASRNEGQGSVESIELPEDARRVDDFAISVNAQYLLDALNAVRGEPVHLSVSKPDVPLIVLANGGEARVYVMPVRI